VSYFGGIDVSSFAVDLVFLDEEKATAKWRKVRLDSGARQRVRPLPARPPAHASHKRMGRRGAHRRDRKADVEPVRDERRAHARPGAVVACIPRDMPLAELTPQEWKQACGLPSNADKDTVRRFVLDTWDDPPIGLDENACDAYAIAWAWRELCDKHSVPLHAA
jgi:hypothetical protein